MTKSHEDFARAPRMGDFARAPLAGRLWTAWVAPILPELVRACLIVMLVNVLALGPLLIAQASGEWWGVLLRDPAAHYGFPPYAGFFSYIGILAMTGSAFVCFFALPLVAGGRHVLWFAGLFATLIVLDDLFMVHEWLMPDVIGIPQPAVLALYPVLALGLVLSIGLTRVWRCVYLWIGCALLGLSILLDLIDTSWLPIRGFLIEDMAKLCGYVLWTAFWMTYVRDEVRSGVGHAR